jgi:hypothetical protein
VDNWDEHHHFQLTKARENAHNHYYRGLSAFKTPGALTASTAYVAFA